MRYHEAGDNSECTTNPNFSEMPSTGSTSLVVLVETFLQAKSSCLIANEVYRRQAWIAYPPRDQQ